MVKMSKAKDAEELRKSALEEWDLKTLDGINKHISRDQLIERQEGSTQF